MTKYEIRVTGHIASHRFHGFDHLTITHQPNGETMITGPIPDQAALFGLLNWLYDLGISLVPVNRLEASNDEYTSQPYHYKKDYEHD
jgi:hypothetical protein